MMNLNGAKANLISDVEDETMDINKIHFEDDEYIDLNDWQLLSNYFPQPKLIQKNNNYDDNDFALMKREKEEEEWEDNDSQNYNINDLNDDFSSLSDINEYTCNESEEDDEFFLLGKKKHADLDIEKIIDTKYPLELGHPNEFGITMKNDFSLKQYQIDTLKWMLDAENNLKYGLKGGIVSLEMGLGKTLISITYALIKWNECRKPSLIVCPKNLIENWKNEIEKFFGSGQCPYLELNYENTNSKINKGISYDEIMKYKLIFVSYPRVQYLAKVHDKYSKLIIKHSNSVRKVGCSHKETIQDMMKMVQSRGADLLFDFNWSSIICDESHYFAKHLKSTALAMMALSADRKWCLTGTPIRNYNKDLFSQMRFLGLEDVIAIQQFKNKFLNNNLKDYILFKSYVDCKVILPRREDTYCRIEFSEQEKKIYSLFKEEAQDSYCNTIEKGKILSLIMKMRLICISPFLITKFNRSKNKLVIPKDNIVKTWDVAEDIINNDNKLVTWINDINGSAGIYSTKITKCLQIIDSIPPNEKIVVYSMFKITNIVMIEALRCICPDVNYLILNGDSKNNERYEILNKFKTDPSIRVIFITYKVGGEGINLVEANHVILLEGWWNYCVLDQAISRVHRIGQNSSVKTWRLIVKDSIEEKMEMICHRKIKAIEEFLGLQNKSSIPDEFLKELLKD